MIGKGNPYHKGKGPGGGQFTTGGEAGGGEAITVVNKLAKVSTPRFSAQEQKSINDYTGIRGLEMLDYIRSGNAQDVSKRAISLVGEMTSIIGKCSLARRVTVYRGLNDLKAVPTKVGARYSDKGFVSTSISPAIASTHVGSNKVGGI